MEELQRSADRSEAFLERLLTEAAGPAVKKLLTAKSKPELASMLAKQGLAWEDVLAVPEMVTPLEALEKSSWASPRPSWKGS